MEKRALKRGKLNVVFPEFPNHHLNWGAFEGCGGYTGEENGIKKRDSLSVFEETEHNEHAMPGNWRDKFYITPSMFGVEKVLVEFWFGDDIDEVFILE